MWNKLNLVTQAKGDQIQCSHCGYKTWVQGLSRPTVCPKCNCLASETKPVTREVVGRWGKILIGTFCHKCKGTMRVVPLTGHPNSPYWGLDRNDGMSLFACKNMCPAD